MSTLKMRFCLSSIRHRSRLLSHPRSLPTRTRKSCRRAFRFAPFLWARASSRRSKRWAVSSSCSLLRSKAVAVRLSLLHRQVDELTLHADSDMVAIGDLRDLSSTAAVMLKTSIFAAWAQLQVASTQQAYLVRVVKPQLPLLCPFWVASLREYARLRTDPDAAASDAGAGGAVFDSVYSGLSRETALPVSVVL